MSGLPYVEGLEGLVPLARAVAVLEETLASGFDPERVPARTAAPAGQGEFLIMPAAAGRYAGVKVVSVAPGNPARGLPRIQGVYLLFDGDTLAPLAAMDGLALTALRTPALSALAVKHLAPPDAARLLVFGTGPQAWGHVLALREVRPLEHVTVAGRDPGRTAAFAGRCRELGLSAEALFPEPALIAAAVGEAELIACCTTSRTPLFPGKLTRDSATVVAVGSHEPDAREIDDDLVARATVVVEARGAALSEAGDVVIPLRGGTITSGHLAGNLADLVAGRVTLGRGPRVFKSVGMAWEDLVVAAAAYEAWTRQAGPVSGPGTVDRRK
ncbi:ornithine cyclodeaminase family protein [Nonomuraea africana]|uniref:Ornithine cyclodeaminase n=1 Tax=Nonomuraea africana TaxID=46171 RepID=A0ABR9KG45_9ACTN|nr:ornithine cyclodeaminase family protein [Nonomuraea africana]MBE1560790.1 ornithine cyclodeaminase [Nonomuraea africana]